MTEKLERIWKEAVMAEWRYYPGNCFERLRKTTNTSAMIANVPAGIPAEHLPDKSLERYC
jgi:hypothetical protein